MMNKNEFNRKTKFKKMNLDYKIATPVKYGAILQMKENEGNLYYVPRVLKRGTI